MEAVKQVVSSISGSSKLPTAKLGKNGPHVTRLGFGTMGLVSQAHHRLVVVNLGGALADT